MKRRDTLHPGYLLVTLLLLELSHTAIAPAQDHSRSSLGASEPSRSQQTVARPYSCVQPVDIQSLLNSLYRAALSEPPPNSSGREQERFLHLASQFPGELWIQRTLSDRMTPGGWPLASEQAVSAFKRRFEARPDDPEPAYVYADSLVGKNTPAAIRILTALTVNHSSYPFPWLTLANIYSYPGFTDAAKMQLYGEGFLQRCPDSGDAVFLAARIANSPRVAAFAKALRTRVAGKIDAKSLALAPYLWDLEYKVASAAELTRFRKRIEGDLRALSRDSARSPVLRNALLEGYTLTFNRAARDRLTAQWPVPASPSPPSTGAEQKSYGGSPAPPLVRAWLERESSQDAAAMTKDLMDRLHSAILRVWTSDLFGFSMTDQNGKLWPLDSLKGKTTLLSVWYTSCGPCRAEMPYLQKLHEQLQTRGDMQVLTLNVDRDEGLVKPFLDQNRYTFPSLYALPILRLADGIVAPSSWIVDAGGVFRVEDGGFAGDGDQWLKHTLAQMENVSKSRP